MDDFDGISDHGGSSVGGEKRRREDESSDNEDNTAQTSKSRGAVTVQIFIKKTYKMINDSDPSIAAWTPEGDKFVIKDPDRFANEVIPQYFDHNKFSSFTRQLNFYKFTREQSKVIKKSDNSSDIAKHQTFYHKYFQRGRPDLLTHLQRSKKTEMHGDDGGGGGAATGHVKRQKFAPVSKDENKTLQQQVNELVQRSQRMEEKVHALEQENNKLSMSVQTLQHQDEMKQRAVLQLEEQIRRLENQLANAFQQHLAQLQQMNQPLPFGRESSLSSVNASALMRYLSLSGSSGGLSQELSRGISRITTPPRAGPGPGLSRLTTPPRSHLGGQTQNHHHQQRHFNAAAAAESLIANESATSNTGGGAASLPRHPQMKQFGATPTEGGADSCAPSVGGPSLPRHPRMKQFGAPTDVGADNASGSGATLPRHPHMKQFGGNVPQQQGTFSTGSIPTGFNHPVGIRNNNEEQNRGNGNNVGESGNNSFENAVTREESFGISSLLDLARGSSLPV